MVKQGNSSLLLLMLSVALAGVLVSGGVSSYRTLSSKAKEQQDITESVMRWKRSYLALAGTQERWKKTYPAASSIPDLLTLISLLDLPSLGLKADTDKLVLKTDEQVTANNVPVGLTKLCIGTGQENFVVEAGSYDLLLKGVDRLAHRSDLFVDNISVVGDKDVPQARIGDLCMLLRSE